MAVVASLCCGYARYEKVLMTLYEPIQFKQTLRMPKSVFNRLARSLAPHMEKGHTNVGNTVETHKRVAVGF